MDKGNGVVIMNTKDYNDKMNEVLEDISKFKKLNFDPNSNNYSRAPWYLKEKNYIQTCIQIHKSIGH